MSILTKIKTKLKSGTWYPFYNTFYEKVPIENGLAGITQRTWTGE